MVGHCARLRDRDGLVEEAVETILTTVDLGELLERTAHLLREHFGGTRVGLNRWRVEEPDVAEVLLVDDPRHPTPAPGTRFPLARTAAGEAIRTRQPVTVDHLRPGGGRFPEEAMLASYGYGAFACFPLLAGDEVLGTLDIAHVPEEGILCQCFQPAAVISKLVGIALHNSLMVAEIRRLNRLLQQENVLLKDEIRASRREWRYVAESPAMRRVVDQARLVAPSETTVLIRGETGTGKEGVARLVHQESERAAGPFVTVNLGAVPETLIESELFGHEQGAFTGALRRKIGRFEQAAGGTLFLDEVGDAPLAVQVKLLRALQEQEIRRVGGDEVIGVDARVVAATNRPLERLEEEGRFRSDLYYRLNIFPIHVPPLRERREDIRPLVRYFVERHAARMHRQPPAIPERVFAALEAHSWPGNVRELENALERALILSPGDRIELPELGTRVPGGAEAGVGGDPVPRFDEAVRALLERALERTGGRIYGPRGAAALLQLKPTTLQGKLRRHGIR